MEKAHVEDGVALTKFLWIKNTKIRNLNELKVQNKLENLEKKTKTIFTLVLTQ